MYFFFSSTPNISVIQYKDDAEVSVWENKKFIISHTSCYYSN